MTAAARRHQCVWLTTCLVVVLLLCHGVGEASAKMVSAMERLFARPNANLFLDGKPPNLYEGGDSTSEESGEDVTDIWKQPIIPPALKPGTKKGRYRATARIKPSDWVRSEDPDHPNMRIPVEKHRVHQVNLLPENSYWKDHDSEDDAGHHNEFVEMMLAMNETETENYFWEKMEKYDIKRWRDENYAETIDRYGLQSLNTVQHLIPKLWFEPMSTASEEEATVDLMNYPDTDDEVPHTGRPFCMKCGGMLGVSRPDLGQPGNDRDPRCRFCGYMNPHDPDGEILNDPEIDLVEFHPGESVLHGNRNDIEGYIDEVDKEDPRDTVDLRRDTEIRCEECGHMRAYCWTAQVRGMDEGQTAFFECIKCQHTWSIKG